MATVAGLTWDHPRGYGAPEAAPALLEVRRAGLSIRWDRQPLEQVFDRALPFDAASMLAAAEGCAVSPTPDRLTEPWPAAAVLERLQAAYLAARRLNQQEVFA